MQATVTQHVVLRGTYQTLPIALYGWAHACEEGSQVWPIDTTITLPAATLPLALPSSLLQSLPSILKHEKQTMYRHAASMLHCIGLIVI